MDKEITNHSGFAGTVKEGMPTPKELAIFLRGMAEHLEGAGYTEGEDPEGDRFGKDLVKAGVSPERREELKKWIIDVEINISERSQRDDGMMELVRELEAVFGPGSVIVEDIGAQNAPSTDTPQ